MCVLAAEMAEISQGIKQLEQKAYFITADRIRKGKSVRKISEEIETERKNKKNTKAVAATKKKVIIFILFHFI